MTVPELIAQFRELKGQRPGEFLQLLAEEIYALQLRDGLRVRDVSDFAMLLKECAEEFRGPDSDESWQASEALKPLPPPEQARWKETT